MPRTKEMAMHEVRDASVGVRNPVELRVTRDPAGKHGVFRVQSRTSASKVNTTVRIISPSMAKIATGRN